MCSGNPTSHLEPRAGTIEMFLPALLLKEYYGLGHIAGAPPNDCYKPYDEAALQDEQHGGGVWTRRSANNACDAALQQARLEPARRAFKDKDRMAASPSMTCRIDSSETAHSSHSMKERLTESTRSPTSK